MKTIKCKYCGGMITLTDATHGYCDYCGQEFTAPMTREARVISMYERAQYFLKMGEFDRAYLAFGHLVEENPNDAELHWNRFLCRYGVQYVEDGRKTNKELGIYEFKPTISRMSYEMMLEDPDYKDAVKLADDTGKRIYRTEAGKLARIQAQYQEIARNEEPYDVFISFKAEENGMRTEASKTGQDLYEQLTAKGLKVFFSRITLENKLSEQYEPYIFAALHSARVLLLVADSRMQVESNWVKNEWSRFLMMQKKDSSKYIIPVYNSHAELPMSPYDFPESIPSSQAQDMGKIGAVQDLVRGVLRLTGKLENERTYFIEKGSSVAKLLLRAKYAVNDREFKEALKLTDQILNLDPENGEAYFYQLLAENNASVVQELLLKKLDWKEDRRYARIMKYGKEHEQVELALLDELCQKEKNYQTAFDLARQEKYAEAFLKFKKIADYRDAQEQALKCQNAKEKKELLAQYKQEIGDPNTYLNRKFSKCYPKEAAQWDELKRKEEQSRRAQGGMLELAMALVGLIAAVYILFRYEKNSFGYTNEEILILWGIISGVTYWMIKRRERFIVNLILPSLFFVMLMGFADIVYMDNHVSFRIAPIVALIISSLFVLKCRKRGMAEAMGGYRKNKKEEYYNTTIYFIEKKLGRETDAYWAEQIGEENLISFGEIK